MPQDAGAVLHPRPGGPAERLAGAIGHGPVAVFLAALVSALAPLIAAAVLLGFLVTDVLTGPLAGPDREVVTGLVAARTPTLTDVSLAGTYLGGAPVLPAAVVLLGMLLAVKGRRLLAAFVVFALGAEMAAYRITAEVVGRDRPHVHRLEDRPVDVSFPSGHTAASVAVYGGLALLATRRVRSRAGRIAIWALTVLVVCFVAVSRLYRGMHHPLDAIGGALIGAGAIAVVCFACRAASAAASQSSPRPLRVAVPTPRMKELH